jgi:hypothetical protein
MYPVCGEVHYMYPVCGDVHYMYPVCGDVHYMYPVCGDVLTCTLHVACMLAGWFTPPYLFSIPPPSQLASGCVGCGWFTPSPCTRRCIVRTTTSRQLSHHSAYQSE